MPIEQYRKPADPALLNEVARTLLAASSLCAIATTTANGRAHINTAYFAWSDDMEIIWLSDPQAQHSRNLLANPSVAIAVYDSSQTWAGPDRGIQLFGTAGVATDTAVPHVEAVYTRRFSGYSPADASSYVLYRCLPHEAKVFDERVFGAATFVTARVTHGGGLQWVRTAIYRAEHTVGGDAGLDEFR